MQQTVLVARSRSSLSLGLIHLKQDVLKSGDIRVVSKPIRRILFSASQNLPLPSQPLQQLLVVREPDGNKIMRLRSLIITIIIH